MSSKRGKKNKHQAATNRLTVKMLEEVLRSISNKNLPILVGDRNGDDPEKAVKALLILGKGNNLSAVTICGSWKWKEEEEENDEDAGFNEDEDDEITAWDHAYAGGTTCGGGAGTKQLVEAEDCVKVDGVKLEYLGANQNAAKE